MHKLIPSLLLTTCVAAASGQALADDLTLDSNGDMEVRLRAVGVLPSPSANITVAGSSIGGTTHVTDSAIPEADFTYFFTPNIAVEAIAGVTKHSVSNSVVGPVASVWLLPPTVTAQYHFNSTGPIQPYVGAGINYTVFYDARSALPNISFANNFGWALQGGADIPIGRAGYFLNIDVKKLFLSTTIKAESGAVRASATLDPWLIGTGIGIRF